MDYWFEEDGTIKVMSKEDNEDLNNKYEHATFTHEQALILEDKNWNLYSYFNRPKNKHVHYIQVRPVEVDRVATEDFFLYQLDSENNRTYDIKLSMSKTALTISAHANLIQTIQ